MLDEACEAPGAVARLLAADGEAYASLGADLRETPPKSLLTIARGSSDHAAHYMAYLIMARLGRLVTSLPMSLITLYQSPLERDGLVSFAFSQSGQSHDLVLPMRFFREGGARTVAFVNDAASPLAGAAQWTFDLRAGAEISVAATKSYIAQLVAGARVVAVSFGSPYVLRELPRLPTYLCAWGAQPDMQVAAARALFGEAPITGRLPVTIPDLAPRGTGIQKSKENSR